MTHISYFPLLSYRGVYWTSLGVNIVDGRCTHLEDHQPISGSSVDLNAATVQVEVSYIRSGRAQGVKGVKGVKGVSVKLSLQQVFRIHLIKNWIDPLRITPNITGLLRFHNKLLYTFYTGNYGNYGQKVARFST